MKISNRNTATPAQPSPSAPINAPVTMTESFLRLPEVMAMVGLKKSAIYERIRQRCFPAQVKLSPRVSVWRLSEVQAFIRGEYVAPVTRPTLSIVAMQEQRP